MFHPQVILHPTDYSDCAWKAFQAAIDMTAHYHAKLIILHVAATLGAENVSMGEAASELQPEGHVRRLRDELAQVVPPPEANISIEHVLAEGSAGAKIAQVANERLCDLIVMGTHGRRSLGKLFTGSVTDAVIRLAPCPVMVVRLTVTR